MNEFKPMIKMFTDTATQVHSMMSYCDYIANTIKHALPPTNVAVGPIQSHLHPEGGYLVTSKKIIDAEYLGKNYRITIEEIK